MTDLNRLHYSDLFVELELRLQSDGDMRLLYELRSRFEDQAALIREGRQIVRQLRNELWQANQSVRDAAALMGEHRS